MKLIETQQTKPRENITIEFTPDEADALHALVEYGITGSSEFSPRKHTSNLYNLLEDYCNHEDNKIKVYPFSELNSVHFKTYEELSK